MVARTLKKPTIVARVLPKRPVAKALAIILGIVTLILAVLGVWAVFWDEPAFVDTITDPFAHLFAILRARYASLF